MSADWRESRPSYVHCIRDNHAENKGKTWCGGYETGWDFVSQDHAIMNARNKGRLLICHKCWAAVLEATEDQVADGTEPPDPEEDE